MAEFVVQGSSSRCPLANPWLWDLTSLVAQAVWQMHYHPTLKKESVFFLTGAHVGSMDTRQAPTAHYCRLLLHVCRAT
jgi:hypothetical protein